MYLYNKGEYMELQKEIEYLVNLKQEGGYWDFKEEWYQNKTDLLHDIICMANNLCNRDAYLIIGVSDNDKNVTGINNDNNRKNTQNIVDFLKDKKFAGGIHPIVTIQTITIDQKQLDVIIIKNTNNTPYYLAQSFEGVFSNQIYTRVQDVNTAKNMNADINHIEYLWKKRFGIDLSIMERLNMVLDDWENWGIYVNDIINGTDFKQGGDWGNNNYIFHKIYPEFRIEIDSENIYNWDRETMKCFYINQTAGHYKAKIFFNNTELYSFNFAFVDGHNKYLVMPKISCYHNQSRCCENGVRYFRYSDAVHFYYLVKDSLEGKIQRIITNNTFDTTSRLALNEKYWLLLFDNDKDFKDFITFANENEQLYKVGLYNNEYCIGDEERGATFPMNDNQNAYRAYVEYLIKIKGKDRIEFKHYFSIYEIISKQDK